MDAKKSSLGFWEGCTSPKGSKWLADNLEAVDENVKLMLKLIEEDGDSFAKKAEMYYQKRPQLISCVDELHGLYFLLAERYYHLFKEPHKNGGLLQPQAMSNEVDTVSQFYTPAAKLGACRSDLHGNISDNNVTSPESNSDLSLKTGSGSLSASMSDIDSELFNSINNTSLSLGLMQDNVEMSSEYASMIEQRKLGEIQVVPCIVLNDDDEGNCDGVLGKIKEYEEELRVLNRKLQLSEEELRKYNSAAHDKEDLIMDLQSRLQAAHMKIEEKKSKLVVEEDKVVELQHKLTSYKTDVSSYEGTIGDLKAALCHVQEHLYVSVAQLESDIGNLLEQQNQLEAELTNSKLQNTSLETELQKCKNRMMNKEHELDDLNAEKLARDELVSKLNEKTDELKCMYNGLKAEKDDGTALLQTLSEELNSENNKVMQLELLVQKSCLEKDDITAKLKNLNYEVILRTEETNQLISNIRSQLIQREEELGMLRSQIMEGAENKREAIRQLCFTLDHYRSGYKELCQTFIITNQRQVSAS